MFELTYNYGVESYERGNAYAQVAISTKVRGWVHGRVGVLASMGGWEVGGVGGVKRDRDAWDMGWQPPMMACIPERDIPIVIDPSSLLNGSKRSTHISPPTPSPHSTDPLQDVYKTAEQIKAAGGTVTRDPGPVPGIGTKIVACTDPDGWKIVLVDNEDFLKELE